MLTKICLVIINDEKQENVINKRSTKYKQSIFSHHVFSLIWKFLSL